MTNGEISLRVRRRPEKGTTGARLSETTSASGQRDKGTKSLLCVIIIIIIINTITIIIQNHIVIIIITIIICLISVDPISFVRSQGVLGALVSGPWATDEAPLR